VTDFADVYRPSEEHEAFRAAVREVCAEKVAPNAAEADELAEFPKASFEALVSADFQAPHIPEEYSGVGADALATAIVIEEIARVCAATSLVPAVNKLAKQIHAGTGGFVQGVAAIDGVVTAIKRSGGSTDGATLAATLEKFKKVPTLSGLVSFSPSLHTVFGRKYRVIEINKNKARVVGYVTAKVVPKI